MTAFQWHELMTQWSRDILESSLGQRKAYMITPEAVRTGWLGYPGATEAQILQAEQRLGVQFPPSYRAFLQVSNGWTVLTPFTGTLWSTEQVDLLQVHDPEFIEILTEDGAQDVPDNEYFVYGKGQNRVLLRTRYLATAIAISDSNYRDGDLYVLNPQVTTVEGEWEAWHLSADERSRYRSFWDLMRDEYELFLSIKKA